MQTTAQHIPRAQRHATVRVNSTIQHSCKIVCFYGAVSSMQSLSLAVHCAVSELIRGPYVLLLRRRDTNSLTQWIIAHL